MAMITDPQLQESANTSASASTNAGASASTSTSAITSTSTSSRESTQDEGFEFESHLDFDTSEELKNFEAAEPLKSEEKKSAVQDSIEQAVEEIHTINEFQMSFLDMEISPEETAEVTAGEPAEENGPQVKEVVQSLQGSQIQQISKNEQNEVPDQELDISAKLATDVVQSYGMKDDLSLPAVLCDVELLQEIANIPDRLAFKIGDVADMLGIKQYVLRYWESEFELLKPKKASNNQRMYSKKDVENAYLIRKLLHRDRFSIEGARQALRSLKNHVKKEKTEAQVQVKLNQKFEHLRGQLEVLLSDVRKLKAFVEK